MLFLSGCGEDGSFSAGGVSLGGAGTGISVGGSNTNPPTPGNPEEEEPILPRIDHFVLLYSAAQFQNCDGMERTFQFIDKATGKVISAGSGSVLSSMDSKDFTHILLRVKIKNTTSQVAYEYIDACKTPVKITSDLNGENNELDASQRFSCANNDSYMQIYQVNEQKTYDFDFDLPNQVMTWKFSYQPQYSFGLLTEKRGRTQCNALETSLNTIAVEDKSSTVEWHLDDDIVVIEPSLPVTNPPSLPQLLLD